jgi:DNA-directed RNA polymerase delta subunit
MKTLRCLKMTPQGRIEVIIRFIGKAIYIKKGLPNDYVNKVAEQMILKGAIIKESRNWFYIDIFGDKTMIKLGDEIFDLEETPIEKIEEIMADFYTKKYQEGGFEVKNE